MNKKIQWNEYFINLAEQVSLKSYDQNTKVGAVLVGPDNEIRSTGYNGFPRGVNDDLQERHERPEKYLWVAHAELNVIANAARCGVTTKGCRLYLNWLPIPCNECCKAVINAGIIEIRGPNRPFTSPSDPENREGWDKRLKVSEIMLKEAGIPYIY